MVIRLEKRLVTMIWVPSIAIAFIFIGPSQILGFPEEFGLMCIGLGLLGFTAGCSLIPIFPELVDFAKDTFGGNQTAVESITNLYGIAFSIGHIAGPYMGAQLTASFSFKECTDLLAAACLSLSIIYFTFGNGCSALKLKDKKNP
jgi:Na+/proline symporter